ncbi:hypothetical protein [Streptomyces sp. NPDC096153]|uniref:hypothetical protein n=1 Tax=Streptomyces sp. NPDC096153 TaxID=3155548 RepID=UPI003319CFD1
MGTPSELIDESGELAWHTRSTLWGTTTWARSSTAYTPLRFRGQYFDLETGCTTTTTGTTARKAADTRRSIHLGSKGVRAVRSLGLARGRHRQRVAGPLARVAAS